MRATPQIRRSVSLPIPDECSAGITTLHTFSGLSDPGEHIALELGSRLHIPLVRVHSECLTGDVFGSQRCDCGPQLDESIRRISASWGFVLYLRQEGRGIGLYEKIDAYALQEAGLDTFDANRALGHADDGRDYTVAAEMLQALGVGVIDLLTNNPDKGAQLRSNSIVVATEVPTAVHEVPANRRYLEAKVLRAGHRLSLSDVTMEHKAVG